MDKQRIEERRGRCDVANKTINMFATPTTHEYGAYYACLASLVDIPDLLAELDRLTTENERLRVERDALRERAERIG